MKENIKDFLKSPIKSIYDFLVKYSDDIFFLIIVILSAHLVLYTFIGCRAYINSDSCFIVDYSLEQIKTGKVFPPNWVNTNDFWVYSLIPLITLFIKCGFRLFFSRQLACFLQSILLFILLTDLFKNVLKDKVGLKIVLLLLLSGISGQVAFELFGDATYGTIVLFMLLILILFIRYISGEKYNALLLSSIFIILTAITACSLRFPAFIGAPLICCILFFIYHYKLNKKIIRLLFVIVLSIIVGVSINKVLTNRLLFVSNYSTETAHDGEEKKIVESYEKLNMNVYQTVYNYLTLSGSTYNNTRGLTINYNNSFIDKTSPFIFITFIRFIYAIITFLLIFILIKKLKIMSLEEQLLYVYTTSLTFIIAFFLIIGNMSWWYRYITPVLFFMNLLYPLFFKYYMNKELKNKVVFMLYIISCSLTAFLLVVTSEFSFKNMNFRINPYDEMINFFVDNDLYFGYCYQGYEANVFYTLSNGKVRVLRLTSDGTKPRIWLCSTDWYTDEPYNGSTFIMRRISEGPRNIEKKADFSTIFGDFIISIYDDNRDILNSLESTDFKIRN